MLTSVWKRNIQWMGIEWWTLLCGLSVCQAVNDSVANDKKTENFGYVKGFFTQRHTHSSSHQSWVRAEWSLNRNQDWTTVSEYFGVLSWVRFNRLLKLIKRSDVLELDNMRYKLYNHLGWVRSQFNLIHTNEFLEIPISSE